MTSPTTRSPTSPWPARSQGDPAGRARDARPDGHPGRVRRRAAARGRPHHRLAAHDRPDRGADRDADRARRRGALVPAATSSPPRTTPPRRSSSAPTAPPTTPRACRSSPGRARRWRSTGGAPSRRCAGRDGDGPNMILDDGGDATMLVHKGTEYEAAGAVPDATEDDSEEWTVVLDLLRRSLAEDPQSLDQDRRRHPGRHRGDHHRRAPPLPDVRGRRAAVPGDQRQRLGHQVEVRQPLRLPPQPDRRHQPGHRRHDRRQDRGRVRLRRRRQGLRRSRCAARVPG